jgi:hypothetical protein
MTPRSSYSLQRTMIIYILERMLKEMFIFLLTLIGIHLTYNCY